MSYYNKDRDNATLGKFYTDHVSAMTREWLHKKSDIASELAVRDARIAELERECAQWRLELRIYRETENKRIAELEQSVTARDTEIARLETDLELARRDVSNLLCSMQHIAEYWNRDQNESAMADALWHIIEVAQDAIEARAGNGGGV